MKSVLFKFSHQWIISTTASFVLGLKDEENITLKLNFKINNKRCIYPTPLQIYLKTEWSKNDIQKCTAERKLKFWKDAKSLHTHDKNIFSSNTSDMFAHFSELPWLSLQNKNLNMCYDKWFKIKMKGRKEISSFS